MDENEVVVLDLQLDSADAEKTLGRLLESTESFKDLFETIGAGMSKMFSALQNSLGKTVTNIDLLTQALGKATEAVEKLVRKD